MEDEDQAEWFAVSASCGLVVCISVFHCPDRIAWLIFLSDLVSILSGRMRIVLLPTQETLTSLTGKVHSLPDLLRDLDVGL